MNEGNYKVRRMDGRKEGSEERRKEGKMEEREKRADSNWWLS